MKKVVILLGMLLCAGFVFCNERSDNFFDSDAGAFSRVDYYLSNNFSTFSMKFKNVREVADDIDRLSYEQKSELYDIFSKSGAPYFALNMLIPGLGSFVQGDLFGGVLCLGEYIVGVGLIIGGSVGIASSTTAGIINSYNVNNPTDYYRVQNETSASIGSSVCVMLVGGVLLIVDFVTCIARPVSFSRHLNKGLRKLLNADYARFSFVPSITSDSDAMGMTMGLTVRF